MIVLLLLAPAAALPSLPCQHTYFILLNPPTANILIVSWPTEETIYPVDQIPPVIKLKHDVWSVFGLGAVQNMKSFVSQRQRVHQHGLVLVILS